MTNRNRWIGYEEGHEEYEFDPSEDGGKIRWGPIWVTDFFIRIDSRAFRVEYKGHGTNVFWADIFHRRRWRALRSSIGSVVRTIRKRVKREEW